MKTLHLIAILFFWLLIISCDKNEDKDIVANINKQVEFTLTNVNNLNSLILVDNNNYQYSYDPNWISNVDSTLFTYSIDITQNSNVTYLFNCTKPQDSCDFIVLKINIDNQLIVQESGKNLNGNFIIQ